MVSPALVDFSTLEQLLEVYCTANGYSDIHLYSLSMDSQLATVIYAGSQD